MKRIIFAGTLLSAVILGQAGIAQDTTRPGKKQQKELKQAAKDKKSKEKKENKPEGVVTGKEKTELIREQNKANRDLRKQKHDDRKQ